MDLGVGLMCGVAGIVAGVPVAGLAYAVAPSGGISLAPRWWMGAASASGASVAPVALAAGLVASVLGVRLGWSGVLPAYWATAVLGVGLAVVDVRQHRLPYALTVPVYLSCLASFGIASTVVGDYGELIRAVAASLATLIGFLALALAFPGQLGLGDVVLAGGLALSLGWLGWYHVAVGLAAGLVLGAVVGVVLLGLRMVRLGETFPLGPWLLAGWFAGCLVPLG